MCQKIGIDIFSGVGGLSLGAENAGIKIAMAIEKDPIAVKTQTKKSSSCQCCLSRYS